jgi:Asp-tRNA(Asn)/Glu-tRNA(Gln) amidotransferase A subunit family amidase
MQQVIEEGERTNTPVLILSGKFGILTPDTEIPHYDHLLLEEEVDDKVAEVIVQLEKLGVDDIEAYIKKGREVEGWNPYYEVLERAARAIDAKLEYAELPEASEPRSEITRLH